MDDVVNRMARELSDAIAAAVAEDPRIEACRERARAAGFEMKVSLEAVIGFMNRTTPGALAAHRWSQRMPSSSARPDDSSQPVSGATPMPTMTRSARTVVPSDSASPLTAVSAR